MPLPLVAASLGGIIVSALATFVATRVPAMLTALGLSVTVYSGINLAVDQIIAGVQSSVSGGGSISVMGGGVVDAFGIFGAAGVWQSINIVLSGYVAVAAIRMARVYLTAATK